MTIPIFSVTMMKSQYEQARAILGTCPTCYDNWRKNFCASTCHPRMSDFVKVTKTYDGPKERCGGQLDETGKEDMSNRAS